MGANLHRCVARLLCYPPVAAATVLVFLDVACAVLHFQEVLFAKQQKFSVNEGEVQIISKKGAWSRCWSIWIIHWAKCVESFFEKVEATDTWQWKGWMFVVARNCLILTCWRNALFSLGVSSNCLRLTFTRRPPFSVVRMQSMLWTSERNKAFIVTQASDVSNRRNKWESKAADQQVRFYSCCRKAVNHWIVNVTTNPSYWLASECWWFFFFFIRTNFVQICCR